MNEVTHDSEKQKFFVIIENQEANLLYNTKENGVIDIYATYTPKKLQGRGIAKAIVEFALNYADKEHLKIIPSCSYVSAYISKNPKYSHLLF